MRKKIPLRWRRKIKYRLLLKFEKSASKCCSDNIDNSSIKFNNIIYYNTNSKTDDDNMSTSKCNNSSSSTNSRINYNSNDRTDDNTKCVSDTSNITLKYNSNCSINYNSSRTDDGNISTSWSHNRSKGPAPP